MEEGQASYGHQGLVHSRQNRTQGVPRAQGTKGLPRYNMHTTGERVFHPRSQNSTGFPLTHAPGQASLP